MRFFLKLFTIVSLYLLMVPLTPAASASLPASKIRSGKTPVNLIADSLSYDKDTGIYTAQGGVEIRQLNRILKADVVEYDYQTQVARAEGNVVFTEDGDYLECDFLEMDLETKEGVVRGGRLFYEKENFHLKGRHIERLGENRYRIEDGDFTTCDGERPPWKFTCKKADITLEGLAKVKGATFRIKNYPVLYIPYLIFPAKTKRQSGFLLPSAGSSSTEGVHFNNAYYWAISPNTDATAQLDLATKKGVGFGGEYRYITSETSRGRFYGYYIEEESDYRREEYSDLLDRGKERWDVFYEGKKDFDSDLFARFKVDVVSDQQFYKDYGSQTKLRTAERTETTAFLTKHWEGASLVGDVEYNYDLLKDNDTTIQRYPQVFFTGLPRLLPHTPVYFSWDSTYNNFSREEGVEGNRFDIDPQIVLPLNITKRFLLQSGLGFRQTSYFNTSNEEGVEDSRSLFHFQSELSTKFMKIYGNRKQGRTVRHTIEPAIIYTYIPENIEEDLPLYDELDRIQPQNRIALAITNRIMGKYFRPDNTSWGKEILFLRFGQYYDTTTSDDPFSNFFIEFRSRPTNFWYIKSNVEYDIYDEELEAFNTLLHFQDQRGDYLGFEYRYSKDRITYLETLTGIELAKERIEEIDSRAGIELSRELKLFFENRQARQEGRTLETIFGFDYHPQCWGTALTYRIRPRTEGRDRETKIMVDFYLKGVGKVGGFGVGD
ncbi:MAG: LPS assembly protein LptD [Pseudomonadota bacterium]